MPGSCEHPSRHVVVCIDGEPLGAANPMPTTGGGGGGGTTVVTDIEDGAGDSVMDPVNNAIKVNVVAGQITADATLRAVLSVDNSTSTPLGAGGVFTGEWEEVKDYASVLILHESSHSSASNGFRMQWSTDGANISLEDVRALTVLQGPSGQMPANGALILSVKARYFRIVYTTIAAQTTFRLQTVYQPYATITRVEGTEFDVVTQSHLRPILVGYYNNLGTGISVPKMLPTLDGFGAATIGLPTFSLAHKYNGTNFDRDRNNIQTNLALSAARTTTFTSADQTNYNHTRARWLLSVTNINGGNLQFVVEDKDPTSGAYTPLLTGTSITTNGKFSFKMFPSAVPVGGFIINDILPRTWRCRVIHGNANAVTYSLGVSLLV